MEPKEEAEFYKKAYQREKKARKEAETILEAKARELYSTNKKMLHLNANLEQNLYERTERIKEAEENYRHLVETVNDIIYQADIDGSFTYINHTGTKVTGYSAKDLIGKNFTFFVDPAYVRDVLLFYRNQLINEEESTYYEYKVRTKDGQEVWLGQNVQVIFKDGFPVGFMAVARNITERVKSDLELKRSEEKYKKMFEGAFDGVIRLDEERNFLEWNSKIEEMLGYTSQELSNMNFTDIIHEEDVEKSAEYFERLYENGFYTNYVGRAISKDGKIIDIEVNSTATHHKGEFSGSIDNVRDITERVSIEKAIIQSEEKYRGIMENLELGLLEVDLNGKITKVYPSFCKLTGFAEEELLGSDPYDFLHPDFHKMMNKKTEERKAGESDVYEVKIKTKSGDYKWIMISGAPFYDEQGDLSGSIGVHLDISKQKKMQADLKKANDLARASSKAKELFLANMSHEIRTPLNAVIGLSGLLKKTNLDMDQVNYVSDINDSAKSLLLLVNDILDITKIESGKLEINNAPFNVRRTLRTILSSANYLSHKKDITLKLDIDERIEGSYLGDELKLSQILINLTNNAIKFTSKGGVTIRLGLSASVESSDTVLFEVIDTGKGIAPEALDSIFDDFSQENASISQNYGGTGLGLSISQKFVQLMGGELKVSSEVGKGTTFYFAIELNKGDIEVSETENGLPQVDWSKIRILTAEDNPVNQFVVQSTIKSWGGHTDIANNGQEAIEKLQAGEYDIILMDMQMPVMDGIASTKYIRQELKSEIPIIAFTANAIKSERDRCFAIGMNDYCLKPFQEEELKRKILNLVFEGDFDENIIISEEEMKEDNGIFTLDRLRELSRGDEQFVNRMLTIFVEDGTNQLNQMKESKDPDEIGRLAHKIKPSIDYLSNEETKLLVRKVEQREFENDPLILDEFVEALTTLLERTQQEIDKILK